MRISQPVAGVAVGVVTRTDDVTGDITDYRLLTDLLVIIRAFQHSVTFHHDLTKPLSQYDVLVHVDKNRN